MDGRSSELALFLLWAAASAAQRIGERLYSGDTHVHDLHGGDVRRTPEATSDVLLRYGQEYRMSFGHRTVLGNDRMLFPLVSALLGSARSSPLPALFDYLRRLRKVP